jgi:uncharacterized protein YggE
MLRRVAPALVALLILSHPGLAAAGPRRQITVSGQGEVGARPDLAQVTAGVVSQAETAREALDTNSAATAAVIAVFKGEEIEPRDIETANFSLQPVYVYPQSRDGVQEPPRVVGYTVSNSVTVRVRDLGKLGTVLDKAVSAGANTINGVAFQVSKQSELLDDARSAAVKDALRKANLYAAAAGAKLGKVVAISEDVGGSSLPQPAMRMDTRALGAVPMEAGEQRLAVAVAVTVELVD